MNVWHVLGGSSLGGGTYVVRMLAQALLADHHAVTVLSSHPETAALFRSLSLVDDDPARYTSTVRCFFVGIVVVVVGVVIATIVA